MKRVSRSLTRRVAAHFSGSAVGFTLVVGLSLAAALALAPAVWAEDGPAAVQERQVVQRAPSSSASASSSRGSASATRGSSSQGVSRTRPGGSSGSRGVAVRPPGRTGTPYRPGYRPSHRHGYYPYYYGRHSLGWYGYFGLGYYGYPYYPYYYPRYYPPVWYYEPVHPTLGALDLNIKPKRAEVYVDGYWVGPVSSFDGYPGYLWLEKGTHDLVLYREGYVTFHQAIEVRPGVVIRLKDRLLPGVATPPEEIVPPAPRTAAAPGAEGEAASATPPASGPALDLGTEPGRLHLTVDPSDASVYLDGRFLGTGGELAGLRAGLMVNPGGHRLSVVRPSFEAEELEIEVVAGQDLDLAVRLEPTGPGR